MILSREELDSLAPKRSKAIEIEDFVDLDQIDPIYFNQPYYLGPAPGAERAYALLAEAMGEQRKVAIARFVLRNRESLCAIRAGDGVLTLATMRFADEVVPASQLEGLLGEEPDTPPRKQEIEMAKQLIESLSTDFEPGAYEDEYRAELLSLIERKAAGEDVLAAKAEAPKPTKAPDLMAALEESLAAIKGEELSGGAERKTKSEAKPKAPAKKSTARKSSRDQGEEQVPGEGREVEIDGRRLSVTNLDKVLYPEAGFTKGEVIDYYARIAPALLPHLRDRPLTVVRYPDGVDGKHFFEKNSPAHRPDWVRTAPIEVGSRAGTIEFAVCDDLPTLVWLAQLAAIELHPSLATAADYDRPTVLAFDLDPGAPATIVECCAVALRIRALFAGLGLESFAEDLGLEGHAGLRPAQRRADLRDDEAVLPRGRAAPSRAPSPTS